jgi:UDPglucose 6-dehydrogenase
MSLNVAVVGLWHQGIVGSACFADWGYDVLAADTDAGKIATLNGGKAPLFEPGLDELLAKGRASGKLNFTTNVADAVRGRP